MFAELKAEHGAKSKDHWTLAEELKALHVEYLEHKEQNAEYQDEAALFKKLRAEHGDKSAEHWTLAEELKALHAEHHENEAEVRWPVEFLADMD